MSVQSNAVLASLALAFAVGVPIVAVAGGDSAEPPRAGTATVSTPPAASHDAHAPAAVAPSAAAEAHDAEKMDAEMAVRTKAFPAKSKGLGGQVLAPERAADGAKVFRLTTSVVDWEVEPGRTVKA